MKNIELKKYFIVIAFAGLVLFAVLNYGDIAGVLELITSICMPFFIGIIMAFILNMLMVPIEKFLSQRIFKKNKKPAKGIAIVLSYLILVIIIVAILAFIVPELVNSLSAFISDFGTYVSNLQKIGDFIDERFDINTIDIDQIFEQFGDTIKDMANGLLESVGNMVPQVIKFMSNIVGFLFNSVMAIVISANILIYKEKLFRQVSRTVNVFLPKQYNRLAKLVVVVSDTFQKYIAGQCIEAVILGALCYIGMLIFRFDYPLLISTVIAATALIPVAGAYIGGIVAVVLLVMISPIKAIMFLIYLVILQQFETNLIYPKVVGSSLELPGIWVIFAVTIGGGAFGIAGILFAVPAMSVAYKLIREHVEKKEKSTSK